MKAIVIDQFYLLIKGPNQGSKIRIEDIYVTEDPLTKEFVTHVTYSLNNNSVTSPLKELLKYLYC